MTEAFLLDELDIHSDDTGIHVTDGYSLGEPFERQISLPLRIEGLSRADAVAKADRVAQVVDRERFSLYYTPDGGSTSVFPCGKGTVKQRWSVQAERQFVIDLDVTLPAADYVRPPDPTVVTASSVGYVQADSFDGAVGSWTASTGTRSKVTSGQAEGTEALRWAGVIPVSTDPPATISRTSGIGTLAYDEPTQTANLRTFMWVSTPIMVGLTLLSASGSYTFPEQFCYPGTGWRDLTFGFPPDAGVSAGSFNPAAVTGYRINLNRAEGYVSPGVDDVLIFDDLRFLAEGAGTGGQFLFSQVAGSAPAPVALEVSHTTAFTWLVAGRWPARPNAFSVAVSPTSSLAAHAYRGQFAVVAQMSGTAHATQTLTVTFAQTNATSKVITGTLVTGKRFHEIDFVELPLIDVGTANTVATVSVSTTSSTAPLRLWLFPVEGEALILSEFPGSPKRVFIDPPDPVTDLPTILGSPGNLTDRSDAYNLTPWMNGVMHPYFEPGEPNSLYILTDQTNPTLTATYYELYRGPIP